jgi:outer membrane protein assembly factor BamB
MSTAVTTMHYAIVPFLLLVLSPADWPQFRGPNGAGIADEKPLPAEFSPTKNVVWKTAIPPGHSSPVLTAKNIFLTAADHDALVTLCLDRATGKILWRREAPRPRKEEFQPTNSPASPSPVTDGQNVYVFFGDFGLISYTADGTERWNLPLGPFNNQNGHGSSPILAGKMLILICDQDTDSYLLAVDQVTGKVRWKTPRPDSTRGYATPAVYEPKNGPAEIIVPGAFQVVSYSLSTGERLWWIRGMAWQLKSVPVIDGDVVYVAGWETGGDTEQPAESPTWAEALAKYDSNHDGRISRSEGPFKSEGAFHDTDLDRDGSIDEREWDFYRLRKATQNNIVAIRAGGKGDVTNTHVLWRFRKSIPNIPSPLLYRGVLFLIKEGGIFTSLDPKTGTVFNQARVTGALGQYWSSPVAGDGKIYISNQEGKVTVLKAAAQWEILAINDLEDDIFSTPAIQDGRIYLRTRGTLYCFAGL